MSLRSRVHTKQMGTWYVPAALQHLCNAAQEYAEALANGEPYFPPGRFSHKGKFGRVDTSDHDQCQAYEAYLLGRLTGWAGPISGLFFDSDPRGCQLKVLPEHADDLPRDWGDYGMICP